MSTVAAMDVAPVAPTSLSVPWRFVRPMPGQPREYFDESALKELAASIGSIGQVVPAIVAPARPDGKFDKRGHLYELIDGQRRWHAVQMAGLAELRIQVVNEPDEEKRYVLSVVANLGRQSHHPLEIATACDRMRRSLGSIEKVANAIGKSFPYVHDHLSLLNLHPDLKEKLHPSNRDNNKKLPVSAAKMLARLPLSDQLAAYEQMRKSRLAPGAASRLIAEVSAQRKPRAGDHRPAELRSFIGLVDRTVAHFEARLGRLSGMDVHRYPASHDDVHRALVRLSDLAAELAGEWSGLIAKDNE